MDWTETRSSSLHAALPNGCGAAALLSAGVGTFALAVIAIASDRIAGFQHLMTFYAPTGPLSGVTTSAIAVWLIVWSLFHLRWRTRNVRMSRVNTAAILLLVIGFLLMFPPIADLF